MTRPRAKRPGSHALSTLAPDETKSVVDQFKRPAGISRTATSSRSRLKSGTRSTRNNMRFSGISRSSEPATNNSSRARLLRPDIEGSPISGEGECIRPITKSGLFQQPLTLRPRRRAESFTASLLRQQLFLAETQAYAHAPGATRPHRVSACRLRCRGSRRARSQQHQGGRRTSQKEIIYTPGCRGVSESSPPGGAAHGAGFAE